LQRLDLGVGQVAPLARREYTQCQRIKLHTDQVRHRAAERIGDAPNLALATLAHGDPDSRRALIT
jgi:hypothetical protein